MFRPAVREHHVLALAVADFLEAGVKARKHPTPLSKRCAIEPANHRQRRPLRPRRQRPSYRRVAQFEASAWNGIGAPKNTQLPIINKLNSEINAAIADPKMMAAFFDQGSSVFSGSPSDFGKLIAAETEKLVKLIKFANIKPE